MPRCCVVKNCPTGSRKCKDKPQPSLFVTPSHEDLRQKWKDVIPEIDDAASSRQFVCEKHFDKKYIINHPNTKSMKIRERIRLQMDAVPSMYLYDSNATIPVDIANNSGENVDDQDKIPNLLAEDKQSDEEHDYAGNFEEHLYLSTLIDHKVNMSVTNSACISTMDEETNVQTIFPLPKMWTVLDLTTETNVNKFYFTHLSVTHTETSDITYPYVDKCILVDEHRNIQYFIHNQPVQLSTKKCPSVLCDVKSILNILLHFENQRICKGLQQETLVDSAMKDNVYKDCFKTVRHNDCTMLAASKYCSACCKLVHKVKQKVQTASVKGEQTKHSVERTRIRELCRKVLSERRMKMRAKCQVESLTKSLNEAKEELLTIREQSIIEKCDALKMHPAERLAVCEIISAAAKKDNTGHRYSKEWLDLSMQMSMRSPSFYNYLRDMRVLPLPCMKTVNKYASSLIAMSGVEETEISEVTDFILPDLIDEVDEVIPLEEVIQVEIVDM